MKTVIKAYVDNLFLDVRPSTAVTQLRNEMIKDLEERYDDCLANGMTEQRAYIAVIDTLSDVKGLIQQVSDTDTHEMGFFEKASPKSLLYGKYSYVFKPRNLKVIKRAIIGIMWLLDIAFMLFLDSVFNNDLAYNLFFVGIMLHIIINTVFNHIMLSHESYDPKVRIMQLKKLRGGISGLLWIGTFLACSVLDGLFGIGSDISVFSLLFAAALQIGVSTFFKIQINRFR